MLTPKREKYVQNLVKGMSQREAYKDAYPNDKSKDETIDRNASNLLKNNEVLTRYNELLEKAQDKAIMSSKERKAWLSKVVSGEIKEKVPMIVTDEDGNTKTIEQEVPSKLDTKIKALDTLNKMDGEYTEKLKLDITSIEVEITDE